jgi:hypothetical protein
MLPQGPAIVQEGKDLRHIEVVIGTGGAVAWADNPTAIIENALDADDPFTLTPTRPRLLVDHEYVLYAVGLLSEYRPDAALELAKHSFGVVSKDPHLEQASERSSGLLSVRH